jgi:hypothetical protein
MAKQWRNKNVSDSELDLYRRKHHRHLSLRETARLRQLDEQVSAICEAAIAVI